MIKGDVKKLIRANYQLVAFVFLAFEQADGGISRKYGHVGKPPEIGKVRDKMKRYLL